jgi:hypothetical protein
MPSHISISKWSAKAYDQQLGVVTETLVSVMTKVSLSFDLWTSSANVALLGIVAHSIDARSKSIKMLLSLPKQQGRQTSTNIAEQRCLCYCPVRSGELSWLLHHETPATTSLACRHSWTSFILVLKSDGFAAQGTFSTLSLERSFSVLTQTHSNSSSLALKMESCGRRMSGGGKGHAASCTRLSSTSRGLRNVLSS